MKRKKKKQQKNIDWYKNSKNELSSAESSFKSVFFVPSTPGSKLLKMLRKTEDLYKIDPKCRIKFIETSGRKYIDQLQIKDPFSENCKPGIKCFVCQGATKPTQCKSSNVGYSIICQTCKDRKIERTYEGETCRNAHIRGNEHMKDLERKNERSVLHKHVVKEHPNEEDIVKFRMKVVGKFKTPISRQINEGVRIKNKNPADILNSKAEFHGPAIQRKVLEGKQKKES